MRVSFTNPNPTADISFSFTTSKVKFDSKIGDKIYAPYNGTVTKYKDEDLYIMHNVDGENLESVLMGIRPIVGTGQKVKKNDLIGYNSNKKLSYMVLLGDGSKLSKVEDLITKGIDTSKLKTKTKSDDNGETESENNSQNNNGKNKKNKYVADKNKENLASGGLMKILLSPISFAQGALGLNKDKLDVYEETQKKIDLIKEDIDRIKKLF